MRPADDVEEEEEEEEEPEPIAYCPKCGAAWYSLEGLCGGCGL